MIRTISAARFLTQASESRTEESVQQEIMAALHALGYRVLSTVHRHKIATCPHCHQRFNPSGAYGADRGIPDLIVRHADRFAPALWAGVECKGPRTALTSEQRELAGEGSIVVVRSVADAVAALAEIEGG